MKISIITPSYDHAAFIEETIRSVVHQDAKDVEHIIVDGGSKDGTVDILRRYSHLRWVSEPDEGQSDAINKGFRLATGDIVAWINSDDYYAPNIFSVVEDYFNSHPECQVLYGDIVYVDKDGRTQYTITGPSVTYRNLCVNPDIVRQPSTFWRRSALEAIGGIDRRLHVVMDYDFFVRLAGKFEFHYVPVTLSYFRDYGENKTHALMKRQAVELFVVAQRYHFMSMRLFKFIVGRFLDGCSERNPVRMFLSRLRKPRGTSA